MPLIAVAVEGTRFDYLPGGSDLSALADAPFAGGPVPADLLRSLADGSDTRLAQFQILLPLHGPITDVLLWTDGTDPNRIDDDARAGRLADRNFRMCFRTGYGVTRCFTCQSVYHTLVFLGGDLYPGNRGLWDEKAVHASLLTCPNCGASLRRMVLKIVE